MGYCVGISLTWYNKVVNITVVGNVCIDQNISEHASYTAAGGPAIYMAKTVQNFPLTHVNILAPYGNDFLDYIGDVSLFPKKPQLHKTLVYENISGGTMRTQKAFHTNEADTIKITDEELMILANTDILLFAPLVPTFSIEFVKTLTAHARTALKVLLPQGYYRSFQRDGNVIQRDFIEQDEILPLFDMVIVSSEDHDNMQKIVPDWAHTIQVIMTLGDKGSKYFYKDERIHMNIDPVKVEDIVDSVGSGDIFSVSFAYKYRRSKNIKESLTFANNVARQCLFYPSNEIMRLDIPD